MEVPSGGKKPSPWSNVRLDKRPSAAAPLAADVSSTGDTYSTSHGEPSMAARTASLGEFSDPLSAPPAVAAAAQSKSRPSVNITSPVAPPPPPPLSSSSSFVPAPLPPPATHTTQAPAAPMSASEMFASSDFDSREVTELRKQVTFLQAEKKKLELALRQQENRSLTEPRLNVVIQSLRSGLPADMSGFRSLVQKQQLLDCAIFTEDSTVVLSVVLFLASTLSETILETVLKKYPTAARIYLTHAKRKAKVNRQLNRPAGSRSLADTYSVMNCPLESALQKWKEAREFTEPLTRLRLLHLCIPSLRPFPFYMSLLDEEIQLLDRQIKIDSHDQIIKEKHADPMFNKFPPDPIAMSPLNHTLFYSLFYHPTATPDKLSSPQNMKSTFKIDDRRMFWLKLQSRAKVGDWQGGPYSVHTLPQVKGMLGSLKFKSPFGFAPFVEAIAHNNGPRELMELFTSLIDNSEEKATIAIKFGIWPLAIDAFVQQKDKVGLILLKNKLMNDLGGTDSAEYRAKIDEIVASKKIKWKDNAGRRTVRW